MLTAKKQCYASIITCLFLVVFSPVVHAATEVDKVQKNVDVAIDTLQETQKLKDRWADEEASLAAMLKEQKKQQRLMARQKQRLRKQLTLMQERVIESRRRVEEVERIRLGMRDFLDETFLRLQGQIDSEFLPFLTDERQGRLNRLEELLLDDTVSMAEKFRHLAEALQIEADYGRSMEVVREPVQLGQKSLIMDVLRIGRLSLFSRTPDGTSIAVFDQAAGSWQPMPASYERSLSHAIRVANKTLPVEIVSLPLGRISGSEEIKVGQ